MAWLGATFFIPGTSPIIADVIFGRLAIRVHILIIMAPAPNRTQILPIATGIPTPDAINITAPRTKAIIWAISTTVILSIWFCSSFGSSDLRLFFHSWRSIQVSLDSSHWASCCDILATSRVESSLSLSELSFSGIWISPPFFWREVFHLSKFCDVMSVSSFIFTIFVAICCSVQTFQPQHDFFRKFLVWVFAWSGARHLRWYSLQLVS